ncbi:MAG: PilZ domain-containing protein [Chloroflexi bacterium]|nr:PilZ domain-containing protein [Chloroflexota bacterium]
MEERRKIARKYLMAYSSVYEQSTGKMLGYLSDLTLEGLMVIGKEELEIGRETEIRIDLPEIPAFKENFLQIGVRIIWVKPDIDPRLNNIGFNFTDISEEQKLIISEMIDIYEFRREN